MSNYTVQETEITIQCGEDETQTIKAYAVVDAENPQAAKGGVTVGAVAFFADEFDALFFCALLIAREGPFVGLIEDAFRDVREKVAALESDGIAEAH